MFTKRKKIDSHDVRVVKYKTVVDWDAVFVTGFIIFLALAALSSCGS